MRSEIVRTQAREGQRRRRQRLQKEGKCVVCGGIKEQNHYVRCDVCLKGLAQRSRNDRRERREKGLCERCNNHAESGYYCLKHWFMNTAYNHFKVAGKAPILKEIWREQKGRCAYTGEKLKPGVNASIDHIKPISKGGKTSKKNLQWVTKKVNTMKRNFTHIEFLRLCKKIVLYHP